MKIHPSAMKIHPLLLIGSIILMATPGMAPDTPHDSYSCTLNGGFCYHDVKCPWCFGQYGSCDSHVLCCFRESWRPECEDATTPADANSPRPTEPIGPHTDPPQKTHQADKRQ